MRVEAGGGAFEANRGLGPVGRRPLRLPEATSQTILSTSLPTLVPPTGEARASIVLVTFNQLVFTRACVVSLLANTPICPEYEVVVVDNASTDGTPEYLQEAAERQPHIRLIRNPDNRGFAPAVNQGCRKARGG